MADRDVVGVEVILSDRADDDFAGVETGADLEVDASLESQLLGVTLDPLLHPKRRVDRALGMILVSQWCAEQSENTVASRLRDVTLVAMDGVHHDLQSWIDDSARLL